MSKLRRSIYGCLETIPIGRTASWTSTGRSDLISMNDLQVAQDAEAKAKVDVETAAEHLRLLGNDPDRPNGVVDINGPVRSDLNERSAGRPGRRSQGQSRCRNCGGAFTAAWKRSR